MQLIDAEAHRKAVDAFLDVIDTDIAGSAAAVAVSDMLYEILVLTRLHKPSPATLGYEDLFSP